MSNALAGFDRSGVRSSNTPLQSRRASCACWGIGCVKPGACGGAIIIANRLVGMEFIIMGQSIEEVVGVLPAAPGCVWPGHPYWGLDCQVQSKLGRYE